ncbi:uncharacterized protein RSE6_06838 [Rhynchosporium secalis]|uniref:Uncharacterized protein n=1 Tax=Rhynchosporium secalis TaxID=38038 RepID=A0A1E1MBF0_RHYSE|nr:uncharacterized protein RSE6_06838 [Rhynchosporium secalis]
MPSQVAVEKKGMIEQVMDDKSMYAELAARLTWNTHPFNFTHALLLHRQQADGI